MNWRHVSLWVRCSFGNVKCTFCAKFTLWNWCQMLCFAALDYNTFFHKVMGEFSQAWIHSFKYRACIFAICPWILREFRILFSHSEQNLQLLRHYCQTLKTVTICYCVCIPWFSWLWVWFCLFHMPGIYFELCMCFDIYLCFRSGHLC